MVECTVREVFDKLRASKKVKTQVEFATKLGYHESSISKFFKNNQVADVELIAKVNSAFPGIQDFQENGKKKIDLTAKMDDGGFIPVDENQPENNNAERILPDETSKNYW